MTTAPTETYEGTWLEVHRGPDQPPWFYVTKCVTCLDFNETLEGSAMAAHIWSQRGKVLLAFARAHHAMVFEESKPHIFFHELSEAGWPDEELRGVAELMFDTGLDQPAGAEPLIVRERRVIAVVGEFREERRQRLGHTT